MFQVMYDYQQKWPKNHSLNVKGEFAQEISVSPVMAQRRVNGYLAQYVTMMVSASTPTLFLSQPPVWRVPAILSLPGLGEVSTIGTVDVNAETGEIIPLSESQLSRMQEIAHALAAHFAPQTTTAS
ncbi:MAG: hypothetical protein KDE56_21240 [Anaerolineales bacterium]|nr:hypothetical protein [Anaerolineales bacterium]